MWRGDMIDKAEMWRILLSDEPEYRLPQTKEGVRIRRLEKLLRDALNFIPPSGEWDGTTKIRESILEALEPKP